MSRCRLLLAMLLVGGPAAAAPLEMLGWLQGCWAAPGSEAGSVEIWSSSAGGSLLGLARSVRDGRTVAHEFLQIRDDGQGIAFIAQPSGQPQARFPLRLLDSTQVLFENPAHDFPQRISYQRQGRDAVLAAIEGREDGRIRRIEFPMRRVSCVP